MPTKFGTQKTNAGRYLSTRQNEEKLAGQATKTNK